MLGFGSVIGAGLFVASGVAVSTAGPSVLIGFIIGGVALAGVLSALAEMAAADPAPGGLRRYAGETLGPWIGFTTGWMYWASGVLTMSSEVTAAALIAHLLVPGTPVWLFSLVFSAGITAINFIDVRGYGKVESGLTLIKVAALAGFVLIAGYFALTGARSGLISIVASGTGIARVFPTGPRGLASAMLMVMFAYAGIQVVAMAAPDTENPARTVPRALWLLTFGIVALYLLVFALLLVVFPWADLAPGTSPFVQALQGLGLRWVDTILSLVILSAALSTLNSHLYGVGRMLSTLARDGEAPRMLGRVSRAGVPGPAVAVSALVLAAAVVTAYLLPHQAYVLITSASGFVSMFNWSIICLAHLRFRPLALKRSPDCLVYRAPGFPYLSLLTIAIAVGVLFTTPLMPGQTPALFVGVAMFALISIIYFAVARPRLAGKAKRRTDVRRYEPEPEDVRNRGDRLRQR